MAKSKSFKSTGGYPKIIWAAWFLLLATAIWWALERFLYQDSAFILFRICNFEFPLDHNRWGLAPMQFPAWLLAKMEFPVAAIIYAYSVSGILLPLLSSWIIWRVNKENNLFLLPLFILTLTGLEWYFLGISEMVPALCYCSIFIAFLFQSSDWKRPDIYLASFFALLAFFTHPGTFPLLLFVSVLHWVLQQSTITIAPLAVIAISAILKKFILQNSSYENELLARLEHFSPSEFIHSWTWKYFLGTFTSYLLLPSVLFIIGLIILRKKASTAHWFLLLLALVLAMLLIVVVFGPGDSNLMMEKSFAPMVIMLVVPIVLFSSKSPAIQTGTLLFCLIITSFSTWKRYDIYTFYHGRIQRLNALLQRADVKNEEKVYFPADALNVEEWRVTWALPYESLLLSRINNSGPTTVKLYQGKPDTVVLNSSNLFYGAEFAFPIHTDTMNRHYFPFSPNSKYHLIRMYLKSNFQVNSEIFSERQGVFRISGWWPEKEKQRSIALKSEGKSSPANRRHELTKRTFEICSSNKSPQPH